MATIKRFEDLKCWQQAKSLTTEIFDLTDIQRFSNDWVLKKQIRSAALSVMSNVAEGFERDGNKEFVNFLSIAKGSSGEVRSQLYIARERRYISDNEFVALYHTVTELSRTIDGLMRYLKQSGMKGRKFR